MKQSKIPVPSKNLAVSFIPMPVNKKKSVSEKENNSQVKVSSKLQVPSCKSRSSVAKLSTTLKPKQSVAELPMKTKPKHSVAKLPTTSKPISKRVVEKPVKKMPPNFERSKKMSSCPKVKLIKEQKPLPKFQELSRKSLMKSEKPISTNTAKRLPSSSSISNLQLKRKNECRPKTISKMKTASETLQNVQDSSYLEKLDSVEKVSGNDAEENLTDKSVTPVRLKQIESNLDENDSEFQASDFYKTLILAERELSPAIMKFCANKNFSAILANTNTPDKILKIKNASADDLVEDLKRNSVLFHRWKGKVQSSPYYTNTNTPGKILQMKNESADDLVEDIKRNSILFHRGKGKLQPSPYCASTNTPEKILQMKNISADDLVKDLRRNSVLFHRWKGKLQSSPYYAHKDSPFKRTPSHLLSAKENLGNDDLSLKIKRESESKGKVLEKSCLGIFNQNFRRWTTNTPREFAAVDEVRRLSEIRKKSEFQISNKSLNPASCCQIECLNPHEKVLRELKVLTLKKKEKSKKKVTFNIPEIGPTNCTISKETASSDLKSELTTIFENSSKNSTPELNSNLCKLSTNGLKSGNSEQNIENPSQVTTPELHLTSFKNNANECDNKQDCKTEVTTPELDLKTPYCANKVSLDSAPLDTHFEKLQISNQFSHSENLIISNNSSKNIHSPTESILSEEIFTSASKNTIYMPTTCLIQSIEKMAVTCLPQQINQDKKESPNRGKLSIFTPQPVSLYSHSKLLKNVTPIFLTGNSASICSYVPIYTPYALKSLSENEEYSMSPIRKKLQFNEPELLNERRRESQIYIQNIPTLQKTYDYLCDLECSIFSSQMSTCELNRNLKDPVAMILSEGDQMHFLPVEYPERNSIAEL